MVIRFLSVDLTTWSSCLTDFLSQWLVGVVGAIYNKYEELVLTMVAGDLYPNPSSHGCGISLSTAELNAIPSMARMHNSCTASDGFKVENSRRK